MRHMILAALLVGIAVPAFGADHVIIQKGRRFAPDTIAIAKGDTLTVTNNDEFIHQIFLDGQAFSFDTKEKAPGEAVTEAFPVAGAFEVRCHIHPKMKLTVTVK